MAIVVTNGFEVRAKQPIDTRILLTKELMASVNDKVMPNYYFCICSEDGKFYIYDKSASATGYETGKFIPYEDMLNLPLAILSTLDTPEGKAALELAVGQTLPGAISDVMEDPERREEMEAAIGLTVPGGIEEAMKDNASCERIINAMFDTSHFLKTIDNKVDLSISLIQAIDTN